MWAFLVPTAGAVLLLALAARWHALADLDRLGGSWASFGGAWWSLALLAAGAVGAFHRPFHRATLGFGAAVVAPAVLLFGVVTAAGLAAASLLLAEMGWRLVRSLGAVPLPDRRKLLRALPAAGMAAWATLAGGVAWALAPRLSAGAGARLPVRMAAAAAVYALVWAALLLADQKVRRPDAGLRPRLALPLAGDLAGWLVGAGIALAGVRAGWGTAAVVLAAGALVAAEAARNGVLLAKARRRTGDLERLGRAGTRIITPEQEMAGVAERILAECAVVRFQWFQFEVLTQGSEFKAWWAGPQVGARRELREGVAEPDPFPPALPGFHRRSPWRIIDRALRDEGRVLARLRLWCDPRLIEQPSLVMLDRLLPQMTASVRRCLLDREAREDPLTGVAMRRVLEQRLYAAYAQAVESGGCVAVVLCDLDHFKRINDTYGHSNGDAALVAAAGVLKEARRGSDLCCRYGGEEFVLLLEATAGDAALAVAERVRAAIEALDFRVEGERVPLTLSAGVASFPDLYVKTAAELLLFADLALYEAKRRGRNRCLLDLGQGRFLDVEGAVHVSEEPPRAVEPPRIFA